jgi:hypothetical protein
MFQAERRSVGIGSSPSHTRHSSTPSAYSLRLGSPGVEQTFFRNADKSSIPLEPAFVMDGPRAFQTRWGDDIPWPLAPTTQAGKLMLTGIREYMEGVKHLYNGCRLTNWDCYDEKGGHSFLTAVPSGLMDPTGWNLIKGQLQEFWEDEQGYGSKGAASSRAARAQARAEKKG